MKLRNFSISREQRKTLFSPAKARKVANEIRTFLYVLLSLPLLAAVTACQKDYAEPETVFRCDSAGDHYVYCDIDLDGWTMVLDEGEIPIAHSKYSYQENLWNVYGEWADAHYHVSEKTLMVGADRNKSGRERTAMIIASFNGRTKVFRIIQEK